MLLKLACSDLKKDWKVSLCVAVSILAVVCPLMLLYSLRVGILQGIEEKLVNDPQNLEIRMVGNGSLGDDFFTWLSRDSRVAFSAPLTRSLSAVADIRGKKRILTGAEMLPTGKEIRCSGISAYLNSPARLSSPKGQHHTSARQLAILSSWSLPARLTTGGRRRGSLSRWRA